MEEHKQETQARRHHGAEFLNDGNDDACSVAAVVPHELERVDEDEEAAAEHKDRCWSV